MSWCLMPLINFAISFAPSFTILQSVEDVVSRQNYDKQTVKQITFLKSQIKNCLQRLNLYGIKQTHLRENKMRNRLFIIGALFAAPLISQAQNIPTVNDFRIVARFDNNIGTEPISILKGPDGNFYGNTRFAPLNETNPEVGPGQSPLGSIFKFDNRGLLSLLAVLPPLPEGGELPQFQITADSSGNLWSIIPTVHNFSVVHVVSPSGEIQQLAQVPGTATGALNYGVDGTIYGTLTRPSSILKFDEISRTASNIVIDTNDSQICTDVFTTSINRIPKGPVDFLQDGTLVVGFDDDCGATGVRSSSISFISIFGNQVLRAILPVSEFGNSIRNTIVLTDGTIVGSTTGNGVGAEPPRIAGNYFSLSTGGDLTRLGVADAFDGPMVAASDGFAYGIAPQGGEFGCGTIFRFVKNSGREILSSFNCDLFPVIAPRIIEEQPGHFLGVGSFFSPAGDDPTENGIIFRFSINGTDDNPDGDTDDPIGGGDSGRGDNEGGAAGGGSFNGVLILLFLSFGLARRKIF